MPKTKPKTVEEYIKAAPKEAQEKLRDIRAVLKRSCRMQKRYSNGEHQYLKKDGSFSLMLLINRMSTFRPPAQP